MEHDLGGGHHVEPPVGVQGGIGPKGLHHGLLDSLGVVHRLMTTSQPAGQHALHVPAGVAAHLADGGFQSSSGWTSTGPSLAARGGAAHDRPPVQSQVDVHDGLPPNSSSPRWVRTFTRWVR